MIRFVVHHNNKNTNTLGLVMLPVDLAGLINGSPMLIDLAKMGLRSKNLKSISLYFFRDPGEFREGLRKAGVLPGMIVADTTVAQEQAEMMAREHERA
jgi:hypothetical protein